MTEDLIDALAKRLFEIADVPIEAGPLTWAEATMDEGRAPWRRLAQETLRQMEWARFEAACNTETAVAHGGEILHRVKPGPLTLAPEDWTP